MGTHTDVTDSGRQDYKGADRSEVAPGDQITPNQGARSDAQPGAQDSDDGRQERTLCTEHQWWDYGPCPACADEKGPR